MSEVVQVSGHGPMFALRHGWTLDRIKAEASRAEQHRPLLCRIRHRREVVGEPYFDPERDPFGTVLSLVASRDVGALTCCTRCGVVATRGRG